MAKVSLEGKVVAITGGARGIGRCTAEALIKQGAKVAIGDLDGELCRLTASELGSGTQAFDLNVTDRQSFDEFYAAVTAAMGPIDVLINNAGIMPLGALVEESDETAIRQIDINLHGVIFGTKIALKHMLPRNSGHIVNIASMAGKGGFPFAATYCATKHAVVGLSEAVRGEVNETNLEVTCVMPAIVNTELTSGLKEARGVKNVEPEDVADAIVDALQRKKFDVFVPKSVGRIGRLMQLMPRSGREAIARALKADKVLGEIDVARRAAYEDRAAHSDPGVEPEVTGEKARDEVGVA